MTCRTQRKNRVWANPNGSIYTFFLSFLRGNNTKLYQLSMSFVTLYIPILCGLIANGVMTRRYWLFSVCIRMKSAFSRAFRIDIRQFTKVWPNMWPSKTDTLYKYNIREGEFNVRVEINNDTPSYDCNYTWCTDFRILYTEMGIFLLL